MFFVMEKLKKNVDGRYLNVLFKLLVVVLILSTGCMAKYKVEVSDTKKYALTGQNATFVYTIIADEKDGDPDIIRFKIQVAEGSYSTLYKIVFSQGNFSIQKLGITQKLSRYKGRVTIDYNEKPNLKFYLRNISDADFGWNYQVHVYKYKLSPVQKDVKLIKAIKPTIYESSFFPEMLINRGNDDTFVCRADGTPEPSVKWIHEKKLLSSGYKSASLELNSAQNTNTGNYDCIAENIGGTDKKTMSLMVAYIEYGTAKPSTLKQISVRSGGEIEEKCNVDGYPPPKYKWKNRSKHVIRSIVTLAISNINELQFGNYTCVAENQAGMLEYVVQVELKKEIPQILPTAYFPQGTAILGTNAEYVCTALGSPHAKIKWLSKGEVVENEVLPLIDIQKEDAGNYTCVAENDVGVVNRTMTLTVTYIEYTKEQVPSESVNITEGGQITVLCKVVGIPPPTYKWFDPNGAVISVSQQLTIMDALLTWRGKYTCEAGNGVSILRQEVQLNVEALPTTTTTTTTTTTKTSTVKAVTTAASTTKLTTLQIAKEKLTTQPEPESTVSKVTTPRLVVVGDSESQRGASVSTVCVFPYTIFLSMTIVHLLIR